MKKLCLILLAAMIILPQISLAGIYGFIEGKVVDDDGKPLSGASVRIMGTKLGALTNKEGKYRVANIPAGEYEVQYNFTGMEKRSIKLRISADQVIKQDIKLSTGSAKLKEIEVIATGQMVNNTQVGSQQSFGGADLTSTSRNTVNSLVTLSVGVSQSGSGFSVRGSRATETQVRVDGRDVSNQFVGGFGALGPNYSPQVSSYATEEVQVLTGGFGAEYGEAMGGIVNTVVKVGRNDRYEGFVSWRTDVPALFGSQANGLNLVKEGVVLRPVNAGEGYKLQGAEEDRIEFGFGGPIPLLENSTFYISTNNFFENFRTARFDVRDPLGNNIGRLPGNRSWVKNITGRTRFGMIDDIQITLGGTYGVSSIEGNSQAWMYATDLPIFPDGSVGNMPEWQAKQSVTNQINYDAWVRINQTLSESSFYEINISTSGNIDQTGRRKTSADPDFFSGFDIWLPVDQGEMREDQFFKTEAGDPTRQFNNRAVDWAERTDKFRRTTDDAISLTLPVRNPFTGFYEGQPNATRTNNAYGLTNFFNSHGTGGFSLRDGHYYQLDGRYVNFFESGILKHNLTAGGEVRVFEMHRHFNGNPYASNPSYDIYSDKWGGNIYAQTEDENNITSQPFEPFKWALFVTDQISYKGIIVSLGGRFEYFNANSRYRNYNESYAFKPIDSLNTSNFSDASAKVYFSPRINVAYPLTDRSNITINYSVFYRMPELQLMYDGFNTINLFNGNPLLGNPNIRPQRTNAYEVNYNNQLTDDFMFKASAYFKDIYNQLGIVYIPAVPDPFNQLEVAEYGNNRGIEFELRKLPIDNFGFRINYTLAQVRGTSDGPTSNRGLSRDPFIDDRDVFPLPLADFPLGRDIRHRLNLILDLVWGQEQGPSIAGIYLLENAGINFSGTYRSGTPYTRTLAGGGQLSDLNSERNPDVWSLDLRIRKSIMLNDIFGDSFSKSSRIDIYADVNNLLNRTLPVAYFSATGDPDNDGLTLERRQGNFADVSYFRDASLGNPESVSTSQYDSFGNRLYNVNADQDGNGIVTQSEIYNSYIAYAEQILRFRGNYQLPRSVFFGMAIVF